MDGKQKYQSGLPLRSSFFGGFKKTDVVRYLEKIVSEVEAERAENVKDREQIYDLMKNGQQFCDELTWQSQKNADDLIEAAKQKSETLVLTAQQTAYTLVNEAQQQSDEILRAANVRLQLIKEEQEQFIEQSHANTQQLVEVLTGQQRQTYQTYEQMLQPIIKMLQRLEGE